MIQRKKKNLNWFAAKIFKERKKWNISQPITDQLQSSGWKSSNLHQIFPLIGFYQMCDILIYWLKPSVGYCKLRGGSAWWSNEKTFWWKLGKISTFLRATTNTVAAASLLSVWLMIKCARQCLVDINASTDYKSEKLFLFRPIDNIGKLTYRGLDKGMIILTLLLCVEKCQTLH